MFKWKKKRAPTAAEIDAKLDGIHRNGNSDFPIAEHEVTGLIDGALERLAKAAATSREKLRRATRDMNAESARTTDWPSRPSAGPGAA